MHAASSWTPNSLLQMWITLHYHDNLSSRCNSKCIANTPQTQSYKSKHKLTVICTTYLIIHGNKLLLQITILFQHFTHAQLLQCMLHIKFKFDICDRVFMQMLF